MGENTVSDTIGIIDNEINILHEEYKIARHEWEYYTELFNKQDNLYSVYFAIFAIAIGGVYYIIKDSNSHLFENMVLLPNQKIIVGSLIIFLAITYMYLFIIMMGNSYYLIIYSEKILALEKTINRKLGKNILFWEAKFMASIQSTDNRITAGYFNVNFLKTVYAILLYITIEVPLGFLWYAVFDNGLTFKIYCISVTCSSCFLLYNWLIMWIRLPKFYRNKLDNLYSEI